jgi:uncharacterized membrane protein
VNPMCTTRSNYTRSDFEVNQTISWEMLSDDQCEEILMTALEVLERTGADILNKEAQDVFAEAGCWVDGTRVRIPSALTEWAVKTAPSRVTLCDRNGKRALRVETTNSYYGPGQGNAFILDPLTGERREPVKSDVANTGIVCDALNNIDFALSNGYPTDVNSATADLHVFEALLTNTTKPIIQPIQDVKQGQAILDMGSAVAGSLKEFQKNPFFAYSVAFHHEAIKLRELLILTLAITGMIFLIVSSIQHDLSMLGVITGLWTAVALSIYTIYSKGVVKKYNPWTALAYGLLSISLLSFLFSPPSPEIFDGFPYSIPLFLFYVCFFSMIIPYGLWLLGLRFVKPHQASITSTLEPVSAILLSGLLLLESITATKLIGCLLIISSVCLLAYQNLHNDKPQKDELQ